eukprot:Gb_18466 [translate_table: standard]
MSDSDIEKYELGKQHCQEKSWGKHKLHPIKAIQWYHLTSESAKYKQSRSARKKEAAGRHIFADSNGPSSKPGDEPICTRRRRFNKKLLHIGNTLKMYSAGIMQ